MLLWLNGPFGVGKTTTALLIREASKQWRLFDPESVGFMLRANLGDLPFGDFQELASWRRLVPRVAHEVMELTGDRLLAVQTVLVQDRWRELRSGLDDYGIDVFHVVLDAEEHVLRERIGADTAERAAMQWRLDHVDEYRSARTWMLAAADLVVDVTERLPDEAAAMIVEQLIQLAEPSGTSLRDAVPVDAKGLEKLGLGLPRKTVRLEVSREQWATAAAQLAAVIADLLVEHVDTVEHMGSTSVPQLLTKPIIDLAARLRAHGDIERVVDLLERKGWEYRGDAGGNGGLVFVLTARPDSRVAHLHLIRPGDEQWDHYLSFRDRLRSDPVARRAYEDVKRRLAAEHPADPYAYTDGKDEVVRSLR